MTRITGASGITGISGMAGNNREEMEKAMFGMTKSLQDHMMGVNNGRNRKAGGSMSSGMKPMGLAAG